jgi:hypothetical protein
MSGRLYNTSGLRFCLNCEGAGCAECEHTGRGGYIGWRGILGPDKLERTIDRTAAGCKCGPSCEWPCWQRTGLTSHPCCSDCRPLHDYDEERAA